MQTQERIYGPYADRGRYRVIAIDAAGRRTVESFTDETQAIEYREILERRTAARSVQAALDDYLAAMERRGCLVGSIVTTRHRLEGLHLDALADSLGALTPRRVAGLYEAYAANHAPDTHRNALGQARTAARFWVRQGWLASNPWESVEPIGRRSRRKRQLKMDHTRLLVDLALSRSPADTGALAVATMLLLGLRSSELCGIGADHFDCAGTVLLIPEAKTEAGIRELELPAVLQPLLAAQAASSPRLFPHRRWWVREQVHRLCGLAGLQPVTAHALRGMHATIAIRRGVSAHAVAAALGHSGPAVTMQHYVAAGTVRDLETSP